MAKRKKPATSSKRPAARAQPKAATRPRAARASSPPAAARKQTTKRAAAPRAGAGRLTARVTLTTSLSSLAAQIAPRPSTQLRVSVRRPDDFLIFDIVFGNLKLVTGEEPKVVRENPSRTSYIVVEFPPQSFGEQAFVDATGKNDDGPDTDPALPEAAPGQAKNKAQNTPAEPLPPMPAARVRMAGRSRVAFTMPADVAELGFDLASVLAACRTWPMRLDAIAAPEPPRIFVPGRQFGKAWLKEVTTSVSWTSTADLLLDALQESTSAEISRLLVDAGKKVGEQAATAVSANRLDGIDTTLQRALLAEVDVLSRRFPALREGQPRDLAVAMLSLRASESLAASRASFGDDLTFAPAIPFLPLLLSPHEPAASVTALELPYRLYLSPIESARWLHSDAPVTNPRTGRTELWHTRLTTGTGDVGPNRDAKIRAIWSPDYDRDDTVAQASALKPFRSSLDALDRTMLVKLMAGYDEQMSLSGPSTGYLPRPSIAHRLMLSALGGLLDSEGAWRTRPETVMSKQPPVQARIGLEEWKHIATLGRDHYVKVVYAGYMCPFGHHASLIKVTERKFEGANPSKPLEDRVAVLRQRFFIVIREPVKAYPSAGTAPGWFDFPFTKVEIVTTHTPSLLPPDQAKIVEAPSRPVYGPGGSITPVRAAFWPMLTSNINTGNFKFDIVATDLCGQAISFSMPLLFVGDEANTGVIPPGTPDDHLVAANVVAAYNLVPEDPRRTGPSGGVNLCFVPADPAKDEGPGLPTSTIVFTALPATGGPDVPHFTPHVLGGTAGIPQVQRLLGLQQLVRVEYAKVYKESGFGPANTGEVFLKLPTPHELNFGGGGSEAKSDSLGALASPAMAIQGISRIVGPVAAKANPAGADKALEKTASNSFDPTDFFSGAKILGGIDLASVLKAVALTGVDVPKMVTRDLPDRIEAAFHWTTDITKSDPANLLIHSAGGTTTLTMDGRVSAPIGDPDGATFEANASLVNFKVNLFGFIILWFDALSFKAARGKKPDVSVAMHPGEEAVMFGGPLEFVNDLRSFIPSNGFSDPPSLTVTPSGISAHYSLSLPSIQVGIFALSNVSLGVGFALPFDSRPVEVKFNFCERQSPFNLTVSLLGGGGFFAIGIGTEGVREIEAALEFGACLAIDLGVASGSVEIKAGVYFHWLESSTGKTVELTGYVRLHGELSVLGLISASLTFNLQLTYLKESGTSTVYGEATLTVEIDILFFSFSVSVKCRREFGGSASDPTVADLLPAASDWADYCAAFAVD